MRNRREPAFHDSVDSLTWTPQRFLRRRAERAAQRRRLRRFLLAGLGALFVYGFVLADGGLLSILNRRHRVEELQEQVAALEARWHWITDEVRRRRDDPASIERLAREEYGMAYPGESIYRIKHVTEAEARRVEARKLRALQVTPRESAARIH